MKNPWSLQCRRGEPVGVDSDLDTLISQHDLRVHRASRGWLLAQVESSRSSRFSILDTVT
ncbi:hypothetical protein AOT96_29075 [Rhodococcus sp. 008]|nr:hypothetical protein AOT96_29075 [Rhodococcus sp. 008]